MRLTGELTGEDGKVYIFDGTLTPKEGAPASKRYPMLGFSTPEGQMGPTWGALATQFPLTRYWRTFNPPGSGAINWRSPRYVVMLNALLGLQKLKSDTSLGLTIHHSHKDILTTEQISAAWMDIPGWVDDLYWTFAHEPETDVLRGERPQFDSTEDWREAYLSQYRLLWETWRKMPEHIRHKVRLTPTLTEYWARHTGPWQNWVPLRGQLHAIGFDVYAGVSKLNPPSTVLRVPFEVAAELNVPLVFGELGAKVFGPADTGRAARANWIRIAVEQMRENNLVNGAAWFNHSDWRIDLDTAAAVEFGALQAESEGMQRIGL